VRIFHVTAADDWSAAQRAGVYRLSTRGQSLDEVGFIHCSYADQVTRVANAIYRGVHGLVLLEIDPAGLTAEVRVEALGDGDEKFPHIYGPLNTDAVVAVVAFEPTANGHFELT
jgi:uncharacterized protein (DUF952 family)